MIRERKSVNGVKEVRGSLVILFDVVYPNKLTEKQRKALNEILWTI